MLWKRRKSLRIVRHVVGARAKAVETAMDACVLMCTGRAASAETKCGYKRLMSDGRSTMPRMSERLLKGVQHATCNNRRHNGGTSQDLIHPPRDPTVVTAIGTLALCVGTCEERSRKSAKVHWR